MLLATLKPIIHTKNLMGKKRWTTPEQRASLKPLIPAFIHAQEVKTTGTFFEDTYSAWPEKWPTPAPTEAEIKKAKGIVEMAVASKRKRVLQVSGY